MSNNEDLELQALQRQLDDAFETTRPRAGFEDELWSRMQARRPLWVRLRDFFAGIAASVREAPAVPAAALAAVLVLAIGIGIVAQSGIHLGGGTSTTSGAAPGALSGGAQYGAIRGGFGRLPVPVLQAIPTQDTSAPKQASQADRSPEGTVYLGPATLVWAGQLNLQIIRAPVYRYLEPTALDADRFAIALGASPQTAQRTPGALGDYSGEGYALGVVGTVRTPITAPLFYLTPDRSRLPPPAATPTDTATAYLSAHSLMPGWPFVVAVAQSADVTRVIYLRQFNVPDYGLAYQVDASGARYGLEVDLRNGQPLQAFGPLPLNFDTADYPIISADQAVRSALSSAPSGSAVMSPTPTVRLTRAELVYALAWAGDHSFYEPAYLFSGTFTFNGTTYVKRVLVPAVDPSQRSS